MYQHYIMNRSDNEEIVVLKRNTETQALSFQKILNRFSTINKKFGLNINCHNLLNKVVEQMHNEIKSDEIDELCVQVATSLITVQYDYNILASAICISNLHKNNK